MNFSVRKGTKQDIPELLTLVRELAAFERAPQEVAVSVAELEKDGFGDNPVFYFFVAETEGRVLGVALYYFKYSTWKGRCLFLEDIIVTEEFRGNGIGRALFDEVVRVAKQAGVRRLEWQVLEWNTPAIRFYEKVNSCFDKEWINCKLTGEQIGAYFK